MVQEETTEKLGSILQTLPAGSALLVTGHSLAGNLSSVMAPWIASNVAAFGGKQQPLQNVPANLSAVTFAAPTAGEAAFAQFLDANPANYQGFFNQNDVVSNVWAESGGGPAGQLHADQRRHLPVPAGPGACRCHRALDLGARLRAQLRVLRAVPGGTRTLQAVAG